MENHKSESMILKRGQTIRLVMSCVVTQEGQSPVAHSEALRSITGMSNDMNTCIGGTCRGDAEKAGQKADSAQSIENRQF